MLLFTGGLKNRWIVDFWTHMCAHVIMWLPRGCAAEKYLSCPAASCRHDGVSTEAWGSTGWVGRLRTQLKRDSLRESFECVGRSFVFLSFFFHLISYTNYVFSYHFIDNSHHSQSCQCHDKQYGVTSSRRVDEDTSCLGHSTSQMSWWRHEWMKTRHGTTSQRTWQVNKDITSRGTQQADIFFLFSIFFIQLPTILFTKEKSFESNTHEWDECWAVTMNDAQDTSTCLQLGLIWRKGLRQISMQLGSGRTCYRSHKGGQWFSGCHGQADLQTHWKGYHVSRVS